MKFSVLLVCTGNSCRSAMAEGILKSMIPRKYEDAILVVSAGTANLPGMPATPLAREVAADHDVDIDGHVSSGLSSWELDLADLILAMAKEHVDAIVAMDKDAGDRTFLLSEFAGHESQDVPDPIGGRKEDYEDVFEMIEGYLEDALPRILEMVEEANE
jgi:protein-tyrosine-phosphatase